MIGCKTCVKAEENSLGWYVKHHIEPLIVAVRISNTVPSENSTQPKECKQQDNEERLNNWRGKTIYGQKPIYSETNLQHIYSILLLLP